MSISVQVVNAFCSPPFLGNPAAVCVLGAFPNDHEMQGLAREINLSETAYLVPENEPGMFQLKWFSPRLEVTLCGHATLASAHALWENGHAPQNQPIRFKSKGGRLFARKRDELIFLDFPRLPLIEAAPYEGLLAALGAKPVFFGESQGIAVIELESEAALRSLRPDFARLEALSTRGVIATARSSAPEFDFISRCFYPKDGINEDPVTGSAHCVLAPHWGRKLGKTSLRALQASERGGVLDLELTSDRVILGGRAVTASREARSVPWL